MAKFKDHIKEVFDPLSILGIKSLKDGLTLDIINEKGWHWIIEAGISKAVLGMKGNKLIWYDGRWSLGTWQEKQAIWKKGKWMGGLDSKGNAHSEGDSPNKW